MDSRLYGEIIFTADALILINKTNIGILDEWFNRDKINAIKDKLKTDRLVSLGTVEDERFVYSVVAYGSSVIWQPLRIALLTLREKPKKEATHTE